MRIPEKIKNFECKIFQKIRANWEMHCIFYSLNYYNIIQFVSMIMPLFVLMNSLLLLWSIKLKRYFPLFDSFLIYTENSLNNKFTLKLYFCSLIRLHYFFFFSFVLILCNVVFFPSVTVSYLTKGEHKKTRWNEKSEMFAFLTVQYNSTSFRIISRHHDVWLLRFFSL